MDRLQNTAGEKCLVVPPNVLSMLVVAEDKNFYLYLVNIKMAPIAAARTVMMITTCTIFKELSQFSLVLFILALVLFSKFRATPCQVPLAAPPVVVPMLDVNSSCMIPLIYPPINNSANTIMIPTTNGTIFVKPLVSFFRWTCLFAFIVSLIPSKQKDGTDRCCKN